MGLELAASIGTEVRATLVLLDSAEMPKRDEWKAWLADHGEDNAVGRAVMKIESLERSGSTAVVMRADITDADELKRTIGRIRGRYGRVDGVVHAAGVPGGGVIALKKREAAARVLDPKVTGTAVLDAALEGGPLDFFVVCSSLNSVFGVLGQVDYCAANAFQDAFAKYRSVRDGCFTVAINWDRWNEVGMAVDAETPEWYETVRREGISGPPVHALLDSLAEESAERDVYITRFSPERHWVLDEHRIGGNAVAPGTAYLEIAREAFERHAGGGPVELAHVTFVKPLIVGDGRSREVATILKRSDDGCEFVIASRVGSGGDDALSVIEHATGTIRRIRPSEATIHRLADIERRCSIDEWTYTYGDAEPDDGALMRFGPRWHTVQWIRVGVKEAIALLELSDEYAGDLQHYLLHPALLDMATGFAGRFAGGAGFIPFWYGSVTVRRPLARKIYSHVTFADAAGREMVSFDIVIMDEQGEELVSIEQFTMKKVADYGLFEDGAAVSREGTDGADVRPVAPGIDEETAAAVVHRIPGDAVAGTPASVAAVSHIADAAVDASGSPTAGGERRRGLSCAEGVEVFKRILGGGVFPQVLVSTVDLKDSIERSRAFTRERLEKGYDELQRSRELHPRSDVTSEYVPPRTETERALAAIWEELLGIERVGIKDNFFELGGDSVLGLRIVVNANKRGIALQPPHLFEYQTIEELAAVAGSAAGGEATPASRGVAEGTGEPVEGPADGEAVSPTAEDAFRRGDGSAGKRPAVPDDFPDAEISQEDLDRIMTVIGERRRRNGR